MKRDQYFDNFFLRFSPELTLRIAQANSQLLEEDDAVDEEDLEDVDSEEDEAFDLPVSRPSSKFMRSEVVPTGRLEVCWRTTRMRLYRYLGFLARNQRDRHGIPYPIFEVLPPAMGHLLGIEDRRFEELPIQLTVEFRNWLAGEDHRRFIASWGLMSLLDDDHLELLAMRDGREESRRYARDSFPAYRPKSVRNR